MMKWKVFFSPIPGAVSTARTPRRLASLESRGWNESIFGGKKTQMGARSSWPKHYRRMGRALRRLSTLFFGINIYGMWSEGHFGESHGRRAGYLA
jgi:hypothetical protein